MYRDNDKTPLGYFSGGTDTLPVSAVDLIIAECEAVKKLLLAKNREYGNSALEPINLFASASAEEQIRVRIDDKLKRIQTIRALGTATIPEDTELDLIGYLVLLRVERRLRKGGA
jgi:hypothetical protein